MYLLAVISRDKNFTFRLLILNCQSRIAKKPSFLNENNPDFIAGTESWLSDSIHNNEIFSSTYSTYRHDRADGYGGVFVACKSTIISEKISLSTLCEIAACHVSLSSKSLILISVYRPPNNNQYLSDLCSTIDSIINSNPNDIIWLAGDLPNID